MGGVADPDTPFHAASVRAKGSAVEPSVFMGSVLILCLPMGSLAVTTTRIYHIVDYEKPVESEVTYLENEFSRSHFYDC